MSDQTNPIASVPCPNCGGKGHLIGQPGDWRNSSAANCPTCLSSGSIPAPREPEPQSSAGEGAPIFPRITGINIDPTLPRDCISIQHDDGVRRVYRINYETETCEPVGQPEPAAQQADPEQQARAELAAELRLINELDDSRDLEGVLTALALNYDGVITTAEALRRVRGGT